MEINPEINSPQVEDLTHNLEENASNTTELEAEHDLSQPEERQRKRQKITENQGAYNKRMVQQSKKKVEQNLASLKVEM